MKQLYLLLFLLLIGSTAYSQRNFQPGFVLQNGDTLRGLVDYRGAVRSATVATFKKAENAPEQTFTPHQIQAYGFDEGYKLFEALDIPAAADTARERVFLNALARGTASVYHYRDSFQKDRYFLRKGHGQIIELKYTEELLQNVATGRKYMARDKAYIQTISVAFSDCDQIKASRYENLKFTAEALADITAAYNQCMDEGTISQKADIKESTITFAPAITYTSSTFDLKGEDHPTSHGKYKDESMGVGGGIMVNVTVPRLNEKLSIQADLLYMPFKQTSSFSRKDALGFAYDYEVLFDVDYLKLPVQLVYTYPNVKLKPYLSAGLVNSFAVQVTQETTRTDYFSNVDGPMVRKQLAFGEGGFRKRTMGLTAGAGVHVPVGSKAVSISIRYEMNESSSALRSLSAKARHTYVMLGYRL